MTSLLVGFFSAGSGVLLAIFLVPSGAPIYLEGMLVQAAVVAVMGLVLLVRSGGATYKGFVASLVPPAVVAAVYVAAALGLEMVGFRVLELPTRLALSATILLVVHLVVLRLVFAGWLAELLEVAPFGNIACDVLRLQTVITSTPTRVS